MEQLTEGWESVGAGSDGAGVHQHIEVGWWLFGREVLVVFCQLV